jgi:hypothetical protein
VQGQQRGDRPRGPRDDVEEGVPLQALRDPLDHRFSRIQQGRVFLKRAEMGQSVEDAAPALEHPDVRDLIPHPLKTHEKRLHAATGHLHPAVLPRRGGQVGEKESDARSPRVEIFGHREQRPDLIPQVETHPGEISIVPDGHPLEPVSQPPRRGDEPGLHLGIPTRLSRVRQRETGPLPFVPIQKKRAEGDAREPRLPVEVLLPHAGDSATHLLESRLGEKVWNALPAAGPEIRGAGMRPEIRNVSGKKLQAFVAGDLLDGGKLLHADPKTVQKAVAVEGIAQEIGMEALLQEQAVSPRRSKHRPAGVGLEEGDRTVLSQQFFAMAQQKPVDAAKSRLHLADVVGRLHFLALEGGEVLSGSHREPLFHGRHFVAAGALPFEGPVGRRLAGHRSHAAQIGPSESLILAHAEREEADSQDRLAQDAGGQALIGLLRLGPRHLRMEQRL